MSTEPTAGEVAGNEIPPTLTITYYQQLADQFTKALETVSAILPALDEAAVASFTKAHLGVPRAFMETAIAAVERNPELQSVRKLNVHAAREALQYLDAFRPILDVVLGFVNRLTLTLQTRHATVARESLQIYDVAKGLARDERSPELVAAVANMKRDFGRRGPAPVSADIRKAAKQAGAAATASFIAAAVANAQQERKAA